MTLQMLQISLAAMIKSRNIAIPEDESYLATVKHSENLLLIKKISFWWRKIQTEQYCVLTTTLLKITGKFEKQLTTFIAEKQFSVFRDEVGIQFLEYIISKNLDSLTQSVSEFELALVKLKLGENIESLIPWEYEPYAVIQALLQKTLNFHELNRGSYEVTVSSKNMQELFSVKNNDLSAR